MNTTPTTSESSLIPYTLVSGAKKEPDGEPALTILLLNRGGRFYREELFREISSLKETEVLYIEGPELSYDIEPLSRKYPHIRFLLLKDKISTGEKINLGFLEAGASLVLVMWSDMKIQHIHLSSRLIEKVKESEALCTVPVIKNHKKEIIPSIQVPGFMKKKLKIIPWKGIKEGAPSIYPFDYCGIYNKKRFLKIGGYDGNIINPYWQKLDFGFRLFLWGEAIRLNTSFALFYTMALGTEDNTPDEDYLRFYLKNLAISIKNDKGIIKPFTRLSYVLNSRQGFFRALGEFKKINNWVKDKRDRFKEDVKGVIDSWEPPE